jgi:amino acid transporter
VLHALLNAVAAGMLTVTALAEMENGENKMLNTIESIYIIIMLVLIIVGIAAFFGRLKVIRRYKIENPWTEISGKRKMVVFMLSVPVIFMLLFAFNEHTHGMLFGLFLR